MFVLGFGIPVLVLYFGYKKVQTSGKRTAIMVLNILLTIFTVGAFYDLITIFAGVGVLNSDGIRNIVENFIRSNDFDTTYIDPSEIYEMTISIMKIVIIAVTIIDIVITAFGVFVNVLGYKALANKAWTANAAIDAQNKKMNAMNYSYGQPQPYQQQYNQQTQNTYYNQAPMQNAYGQAPVQNTYGQTPVQNTYGQASVQNTYGQTPVQNNVQPAQPTNDDWYCVCGSKNTADQRFCSNCGSPNPNSKQ